MRRGPLSSLPSSSTQVDAAYDLLLMQSFKNRQSGATSNAKIKFADVVKPKPPALPAWAQVRLVG